MTGHDFQIVAETHSLLLKCRKCHKEASYSLHGDERCEADYTGGYEPLSTPEGDALLEAVFGGELGPKPAENAELT